MPNQPTADEPSPPSPNAGRGLLGAVYARRGVLTALAILAGLGLVAQQAWQAFEPRIRYDARYIVTPDSVSVTPPPAWAQVDVVSWAFQRGALTGRLSVLGPPEELEQRIAGAVAAHPWVRAVNAVSKAPPNRLALEVEYRRPLAVVATRRGTLLPIDRDAALLPTTAFTNAQLRSMPRVGLGSGAPDPQPPAVGGVWPNRSIAAAAALIDAFGPAWSEFSLFRVWPAPTPQARLGVAFDDLVIASTGSTQILWGAAPGFGPPDEASFADKLGRLRQFIAARGPLNSASINRGVLDVRRGVDFRLRVVMRDDETDSDETEPSVVK